MEYFPSLQDFFILLIHTRPLEWIGGIFSCALRYVFFFYFLTAVFFSCVLLTLTLYFILISVSSMSLFLSLLIPHFVPLVAYCPLPSDSLHYLIFLGTRPSYPSFCAFLRIPLGLSTLSAPPDALASFETTYSPIHLNHHH